MGLRVEALTLAGAAGPLEARLDWPQLPARGAALVCHPHPLHGGSMHTKAVHRTARALVAAGFVTLRFNFRGVGRSSGRFTGGDGELADARSALAQLVARRPGGALVLGGFSFGATVALRLGAEAQRTMTVSALCGIAPPLLMHDFGFLVGTSLPLLLVAGDADPFCPAPALAGLQQRIGAGARIAILPGAGHLLLEKLDELERTVHAFALQVAGAASGAS